MLDLVARLVPVAEMEAMTTQQMGEKGNELGLREATAQTGSGAFGKGHEGSLDGVTSRESRRVVIEGVGCVGVTRVEVVVVDVMAGVVRGKWII